MVWSKKQFPSAILQGRRAICLRLFQRFLRFGASTIGEIYRDRWEIELFFKTLKQNLKVKTFVGESENALRIQIWTALVSLLVIKWLHHLSKAGWSFSNMATMLRLNLFTYRVLRAWLDEPYETPPIVPDTGQLSLRLS
jgi:IS4 transposase